MRHVAIRPSLAEYVRITLEFWARRGDNGLVTSLHGGLCCTPNYTWHQDRESSGWNEISHKLSLGTMCLRPDGVPPLGSTSSWKSTPGSQRALYGCQKPQIPVGRQHNETQSDEPQPLPTVNIFELWEDGSQQAKAASACDFQFPVCFAVMCPWNYQHKALSLREAVEGVADNSGCVAKPYGVAELIGSRNPFPKPTWPLKDPLSAIP